MRLRSLFLALVLILGVSQVSAQNASLVVRADTVKPTPNNKFGFGGKFFTFPDGSTFTTATNFYPFPNIADTIKYVEGLDSLKGAGYATRTMLQTDSLFRAAQEAAIKETQRLDSLYKAAQIALKKDKADSVLATGYYTNEKARVDTTERNSLIGKRIAYVDTSAFPSLVPARNGQSGWLTRPVGWQYLTPATRTDSVLIPGRLGLGSITAYQHRLAIGDNDSTGGINIVRTDKNTNRSTLAQTVDTSSVRFFSTQSGKWQFAMVDNLGATKVKIDSAGNVGIGTTSPGSTFDVVVGGANAIKFQQPGSTAGGITFYDATNRVDLARVGNTLAISNSTGYGAGTAMLINATTGNVGIGTTGPLTTADISGTLRSTDTVRSGNWTTYTYFLPGGALVQSSDESLKANILPFTANLANFKNVSPRLYNFKKEVFLEIFDRSSVPDSVDVKVDSVNTMRVSNLAAKDSAAVNFYVRNLADAERKSQIAYRGFLANEFNPLILGKQSKEINQQDVINTMWLKIQQLEARIEKLEAVQK